MQMPFRLTSDMLDDFFSSTSFPCFLWIFGAPPNAIKLPKNQNIVAAQK
jgi:hypothetical protein